MTVLPSLRQENILKMDFSQQNNQLDYFIINQNCIVFQLEMFSKRQNDTISNKLYFLLVSSQDDSPFRNTSSGCMATSKKEPAVDKLTHCV